MMAPAVIIGQPLMARPAPAFTAVPSQRSAVFFPVRPRLLPGSRSRPTLFVAKAKAGEETAEAAEVETAAAAPSDLENTEAAGEAQDVEEVYEEEYVEEVAANPLVDALKTADYKMIGLNLGIAFVAITGLMTAFKMVTKFMTPRAKRVRKVNKNKLLVDKLNELLPSRRAELTPQTCKMLMFQTGFTGTEVFRKYMWFLLRERKFDPDAMADLAHLKEVLALSDEQVADAVKERCQRIYDKYGSLIMNTAGMTAEGATRKATGRALFSKLLYISESQDILTQTGEAAKELSVPEIFGATEHDTDNLRIVSLYDVDVNRLDQMASGSSDEDDPPAQQPKA